MMDPGKLWAKGWGRNEQFRESMLLVQHLRDVLAAADAVLAATGDVQLAAVGLDPVEHRDRLARCVRLAAAVHDIGKANDHFQGMVTKRRDVRQHPQGLRHEWVSVLLMHEPALRAWLLPAVGGSEDNLAVVEWAVAGHHPGVHHPSPPKDGPPAGAGVELRVPGGHPDFLAGLAVAGGCFNPGTPPTLGERVFPFGGAGNAFEAIKTWSGQQQRRFARYSDADRRFAAAVKACLVAADVAGSALPREIADEARRWDWVTDSLKQLPTKDELDEIGAVRLGENRPREFQRQVEASAAPVTFVKAGCGSGKTLAAYLWAARNHAGRRLYFCYPTTGTATEGYRDYLHADAVTVGADLFHSRRDVDFDILLNDGPDDPGAAGEELVRVASLDAWATPVVSCTVDTVLGLVQNHKKGLFGWPALAQSAFVFDEVHAYDDLLFGMLLRFLRDLPGLPVLLMTASLPDKRVQALKDVVRKHRGGELATVAGPEDLETRTRYHRAAGDELAAVVAAVRAGRKVLWVCNTVARVMSAADATAAAGLRRMVYHSRFKYEDRVARHREVIGAFKGPGPALAVCSQVAEMSLDLSADLLVTDLAPVPALIQRLGRLNRRAETGRPTKPFVVAEPDGPLPYTDADLQAARAWLTKLGDGPLSQRDLARCWEQAADAAAKAARSTWLDGGPVTMPGDVREGSPGMTVVLASDRKRASRPKEFARYALPMPPGPAGWQQWPRLNGVPVAPDEVVNYHPERGAEWRK